MKTAGHHLTELKDTPNVLTNVQSKRPTSSITLALNTIRVCDVLTIMRRCEKNMKNVTNGNQNKLKKGCQCIHSPRYKINAVLKVFVTFAFPTGCQVFRSFAPMTVVDLHSGVIPCFHNSPRSSVLALTSWQPSVSTSEFGQSISHLLCADGATSSIWHNVAMYCFHHHSTIRPFF